MSPRISLKDAQSKKLRQGTEILDIFASRSSARTFVVTFPVPNSMLQYLSKVLKRLTVLHLAPPISVRHPTSMHTLVACKVTSYNISTAVRINTS